MNLIPIKTKAQITCVATLAKEIWTEHFTPIIGPEQVEYMLETIQSEEAVTEQIQTHGFHYYLLEQDGLTVGYCAILFKADALFLSKLYVLKSAREKGVARRTIERLKTIAIEKKLPKIALTVNKNNADAIAAYEKLGFVNFGSVVQDIGGGFFMDDYTMQLNVS